MDIHEETTMTVEESSITFEDLYKKYRHLYKVYRSSEIIPVREPHEYLCIKPFTVLHTDNIKGIYFTNAAKIPGYMGIYGDMVCEVILDPQELKKYGIHKEKVYRDPDPDEFHAQSIFVGECYNIYKDISLYQRLAHEGYPIQPKAHILEFTKKCSDEIKAYLFSNQYTMK